MKTMRELTAWRLKMGIVSIGETYMAEAARKRSNRETR